MRGIHQGRVAVAWLAVLGCGPSSGPEASSQREALEGSAAVWTDQDDYGPGETALISGSGFPADEDVRIAIDCGFIDELSAVTDAGGAFADAPYPITPAHVGTTCTVQATGQTSGLTASTHFTDANVLVLAAPAGTVFDLVYERFSGLACTGTAGPEETAVVSSTPGLNLPVVVSQSVRLTAAPTSHVGAAFLRWTNAFGDTVSTASSICVPGPSTTATYRANYALVTPCTIVCPANVVALLASPGTCSASGVASTPSVSCGTVTCTHGPGTTFQVGSTTVTCTTTSTGGSSSCSYNVVVIDGQDPVLQCPGDAIDECPMDPSSATAEASDNCPGVSVSDSIASTPSCGGAGVVTRTFTATDASGRQASCTQEIAIVDTSAPSLTKPPDVTLECGADSTPNTTGTALAADACSATTVGSADSVISTCGQASVIRRTWTATDACGNEATEVQVIQTVDTTPPTLSVPAETTVECGDALGAEMVGTASAADACGAATLASSESFVPACGQSGVVARDWVATDECANTTSATQTILVVDTIPPALQCPAPQVLECASPTGAVAILEAGASDRCGEAPASCPDSGGTFPLGSTAVTCGATDACGNQSTCATMVTVVDTVAPAVLCPADMTAECTADRSAMVDAGAAIGADLCGGVAIADPEPGAYRLGTSTVTHTATDGGGNTAACTQHVIVVDTTAPTIDCPADAIVECDGPSGATDVLVGAASGADACTDVVVVDPPASSYPLGTTTVTHEATDESGNLSSCHQQVVVVDTTGPTFDAASLGPRAVLGSCGGAPVAITPPTATDRCSAATVSCTPILGDQVGSQTVVCTAVDAAGNTTSATMPVNIVSPLRVAFQAPLADDNVADDVESDADASNVFAVKSVIPHRIKLYSCAGADVTGLVPAIVRISVMPRTGADAPATNIVPTYGGAGDAGDLFVLRDGQYQYNLKTDPASYPPGTVKTSSFFSSLVTVSYSSSPTVVVGQEDARLESR